MWSSSKLPNKLIDRADATCAAVYDKSFNLAHMIILCNTNWEYGQSAIQLAFLDLCCLRADAAIIVTTPCKLCKRYQSTWHNPSLHVSVSSQIRICDSAVRTQKDKRVSALGFSVIPLKVMSCAEDRRDECRLSRGSWHDLWQSDTSIVSVFVPVQSAPTPVETWPLCETHLSHRCLAIHLLMLSRC